MNQPEHSCPWCPTEPRALYAYAYNAVLAFDMWYQGIGDQTRAVRKMYELRTAVMDVFGPQVNKHFEGLPAVPSREDIERDEALQSIANDIREEFGLPPLQPPNPITGYQKRLPEAIGDPHDKEPDGTGEGDGDEFCPDCRWPGGTHDEFCPRAD